MSTATAPTTVLSNRFLPFSVMLHGLSGSGKSACESQLGLSEDPSRTAFSIDDRFLVSPQIYSSNYQHPNKPRYGSHKMDRPSSVWKYGGRGSVNAKWSVMVESSKAQVFVVDSTDRARLAPAPDFTPLPMDYVVGYDYRSFDEQAEILSLLRSQLTAKALFDNLRTEIADHYKRPILILATKQDMDEAMSVQEICDALGLKSLTTIDWRIIGVDATTGEGFDEAIGWLKRVVKTPSDFAAVYANESAEREVENTFQWVRYCLRSTERHYRMERLGRGDVLPAPPLYRANGTIVKADPKQSKEYVLAPLTPETLENMTTFYNRQVENIRTYQKIHEKIADRFEVLMPLPVSIQMQMQEKQFQQLNTSVEEFDLELQSEVDSETEAEEVASNASTVTGTPDASSESDTDSVMEDIPDVQSPLVTKKQLFFEERKFLGFEQHSRMDVAAN